MGHAKYGEPTLSIIREHREKADDTSKTCAQKERFVVAMHLNSI